MRHRQHREALLAKGHQRFRDLGVSLSDPQQDAARRLAILGFVMAGLSLTYLIFILLLPSMDLSRSVEDLGITGVVTAASGLMFIVSLGLAVLAHSKRLAPGRMIDLGLLFEIFVAFLSGVVIRLAPGPLRMPEGWGISEICILLIIFPVIVPSSARKTLLVALVAASMDPLGVWLAGLTGKPLPPSGDVIIAFFPNYLSACLALIPSLVMLKLGRQVDEARKIGSYRLTELLGQGGMGEVWRASHQMLAREAAIKLIRPESLGGKTDHATALQRFEREAQATANLHSHHTIQLYDFGVMDDGAFFYVMELLDGMDLQSLVDRFGPQPAARTIHLLRQACDSLSDAHQSGMIHRDVKPANIYVCRYGHRFDFVKVLDFGLVRLTEASGVDSPRLTMANAITGTPAFMPPELAMGEATIDGRADLYALGCVGYWLLTGQQVFTGESLMEVLGAHLRQVPVPPSECTEISIPVSLERVILTCLEKDPAGRPQTADALDRLLAACEIDAPWTGERAAFWWATHLPTEAVRRQPGSVETESTAK